MDGQGFYPPEYSNFYSNYVPNGFPINNQAQYFGVNNMYNTQPSTSSNSSPPCTVQSLSPSPATSSFSSSSSEDNNNNNDSQTTKRVYEKWTEEEQRCLVALWAENFERLESKDNRKVWDEITEKVNKKFASDKKRPKRTAKKFKEKMKYLIDRYKKAKDWNSKQTGGNRRKSVFYDEIDEVLGCRDIVALGNVQEAGSKESKDDQESISSADEDESELPSIAKKRTERKKTRKRALEEEENDEERKFFKAAVTGLEEQRKDMNSFVENFNRIQTEQLNTMNTLVGALTKFLEKQ